jgi:medium-chain acyl-[acyl-carrier-protein] hydrolase
MEVKTFSEYHSKNLWVSIPRPNPTARVRLFCFPYAGGGAAVFYPWTQQLAPGIELCQIHLPGREMRLREPLATHLMPLVSSLAAALSGYLDRPFAFFGHSMGALVAFELIRILRQQENRFPMHLFISGFPAPHLPDRHPHLRNLCDEDFVDRVKVYDGTPDAVFQNRELMDIFLPILRADFTIIETYQYVDDHPIDCPITAFGGCDDPRANKAEMESWREQTNNRFSLDFFPGGHFYIKQHQPRILQTISQSLR